MNFFDCGKNNNPKFSNDEAEALDKRVSKLLFTFTTKIRIAQTKATGIVSKQGNTGRIPTYRDIAIGFIVWLFSEKRYELVKITENRMFN